MEISEEGPALRRAKPASAEGADRWAYAMIAAAVIVGALLRVLMARGDLWLDETWSLALVAHVSSAAEVFYGISHDNNHFLNSLWLYAVGPGGAAWTYRIPAVLLGILSVALAARVAWPHSRAGAVAAALLTAAALPLVVYGSEARGYAGLIAATLVALAAFDAAVERADRDGRRSSRASWVLGAAIGFGTLSHLTMLATLAVLGLAALLRFATDRPFAAAVDATVALFRPTLICLAPAALAVVAGIAWCGHFSLGGLQPSSDATFLQGYGAALRAVLGLPTALPATACIAAAALLGAASLGFGRRARLRQFVLVVATVVVPAAMLMTRLPNLAMARYYLVPSLVLLLALADLVGRLWDRSTPAARAAAVLLLGSVLLGQLAADASALGVGRGRYGEALAAMAGGGREVRYATSSPFQVEMVVTAAAARAGLRAVDVADGDFCKAPPDWFIAIPDGDGDGPSAVAAGPAACRRRFALHQTLATNPLSGMRWSIYRREG